MNYFGAVIVVASAYYVGASLAKREGDRLSTVDSLLLLFACIKRRVELERLPLYSIFSSFRDEHLERSGFLPILRSHRAGISDLWREAMTCLTVDAEISGELLRFGERLGSLPLEEQLRQIGSCCVLLEEKRKALRASLPPKQKSIKTVALMLGMTVAIILL